MAKQTADIYSITSHPDNYTLTLSFSEVVHDTIPNINPDGSLEMESDKYVEPITSFRMNIKDAVRFAHTLLEVAERIGK